MPDDTGHFQGAFPAVVDMSVHSTQEVKHLKNIGTKVIIRYYAAGPQGGGLEEKRLEPDEADAILNGGLSLAITYQYNNGDIDTFKKKIGTDTAKFCIGEMERFGQPDQSTIYFGVDNGWDRQDEIDQVVEYFKAIKDQVTESAAKGKNTFTVGVYGSGLMCETLLGKGLAERTWIAGLSDDWPGRPHIVKTGQWNMYQSVLEVAVGSVRLDTDIVNPRRPIIGSFSRPKPGAPIILDGAIDDSQANAKQRLVRGSGVELFDRPGGSPLRPISDSKMVLWTADEGDFSLIEVPRQIKKQKINVADFVRGYCRKDKLFPVDGAPTA